MARYSLYAEDIESGNRVLIKVKEMDNNGLEVFKEKVNLSTIDKYTLNYSDEEQLVEVLSDNRIIPFKQAKLYIEYISKKQPIQIPLAYKSLTRLPYFASNAPIKVSVVDPKYTEVINGFLKECLSKEFLEFQIKHGYLHEYNAEYVRQYVKMVNEDGSPRQIDRLRSLLYTELNRYKRIRGIIVGSSMYYKTFTEAQDVEFQEQEDMDSIYFGIGYPGDRLTHQKRIELN